MSTKNRSAGPSRTLRIEVSATDETGRVVTDEVVPLARPGKSQSGVADTRLEPDETRALRFPQDSERARRVHLRIVFQPSPLALPGEVALDPLRGYQVGLFDGSASRTGKPQAAETVHRITTTLAGFFRFLVAECRIERDPTLRLERPKLADKLPGDVLDVEEVERLLAVWAGVLAGRAAA
jgi:integrase